MKSLKLNQYVAMKIVNKTVISNRANYLKLLARMHDMYEDLDTDIISECRSHLRTKERGRLCLLMFITAPVRSYEW